jgi:probable rRNA maturation factor
VTVLNRQRARAVDARRLAGVVARAAGILGVGAEAGEVVVLIGRDALLRQLNRSYRQKDRPTDVLSFPHAGGAGSLGDIAISVDTAGRNARAGGRSLALELETLTLHGFLHLLGYDHEVDDGTMARLERRLRRSVLRPTRRGRR